MNWKDKRIHAINRITNKYNNGSMYIDEYANILKSKAKNKKEAKKIASEISAYDYKSNDWSNSAGDFAIEEIEEV